MLKGNEKDFSKKFLILIILVSVGLFFILTEKKGISNACVCVYYNDRCILKKPLKETGTYFVNGNCGGLTIEILNYHVRVKESSCPNKVCVKQGFISSMGQQIICVPNGIVIQIEKE